MFGIVRRFRANGALVRDETAHEWAPKVGRLEVCHRKADLQLHFCHAITTKW